MILPFFALCHVSTMGRDGSGCGSVFFFDMVEGSFEQDALSVTPPPQFCTQSDFRSLSLRK